MENSQIITESDVSNDKYDLPTEIPSFNDMVISTKTIIAITNLSLNLDNIIKNLPITDYHIAPKKRGRKKKEIQSAQNLNLKSGSIITLLYNDIVLGIDLKKNKMKKERNSSKKRGNFRNSITVVMFSLGKFINFKITSNGKFQLTGCKHNEQAEECIKHIWGYIKDNKNCYNIKKQWNEIEESVDTFKVIYNVVMTNVDFNIGFIIDREAIDRYMNVYTQFRSLLEDNFGYTGINIKKPIIPLLENLDLQMCLKFQVYKNNKFEDIMIPYSDYIKILDPKDIIKEKKVKYNTFLVFHSGKIIMSGIAKICMTKDFYTFVNIILKNKEIMQEVLETDEDKVLTDLEELKEKIKNDRWFILKK